MEDGNKMASPRTLAVLVTLGLLLRTQVAASSALSPLGSGFVVSNQGHIVTANHVVSECSEPFVSAGGTTTKARVVAVDKLNDLALLQAERPLATSLRLRQNSRVKLGEPVLAFGFPLQGIATSSLQLTTGTVSGLAGLGDDSRFLQFTAPGTAG